MVGLIYQQIRLTCSPASEPPVTHRRPFRFECITESSTFHVNPRPSYPHGDGVHTPRCNQILLMRTNKGQIPSCLFRHKSAILQEGGRGGYLMIATSVSGFRRNNNEIVRSRNPEFVGFAGRIEWRRRSGRYP